MTNQNKKIAVGYCRVSTEEQAKEGLSLDVQEKTCKDAIKKDGLKLLKIIRDEGKSGSNIENRPGIREVIELVNDKKIDALYVISSDRVARNVDDYYYLKRILRENSVTLKYINQDMGDDPVFQRILDHAFAGMNELQSVITSVKVKKTLGEKAKAGYFPSKAPIGYLNIRNPILNVEKIAERIIAPDPERKDFITEAFRLYATGNYNAYDLNRLLAEKGFRTTKGTKMAPAKFYELLKNPTYVGKVYWGEIKIEKGKHEPLIDEDTFNEVQAVLAKHNKFACRKRKYQWLLNGFVYCARHNKRYTAEWHMKKNKAYYHCPNQNGCGPYWEASDLESEIAEKFKDLEFSPTFVEKIIEKAKAKFFESRRTNQARRQGLINQKTALESKKRSAEDKLLANIISNDDYLKKREEINTEIDSIEERLTDISEKEEINVDIAAEILSFTKNIYQAFLKADIEVKRHYLSLFWNRFEVQDKVIIKPCPSLLFQELLKLEQIYDKSGETKNPQYAGDSGTAVNGYKKIKFLRDSDSNRGPTGYTYP